MAAVDGRVLVVVAAGSRGRLIDNDFIVLDTEADPRPSGTATTRRGVELMIHYPSPDQPGPTPRAGRCR